jgi:hypothetical protein
MCRRVDILTRTNVQPITMGAIHWQCQSAQIILAAINVESALMVLKALVSCLVEVATYQT